MDRELTTKERILEVSARHFADYGYGKTVLDNIANECKITKPAIYYYFKDKSSLYQEVLCSNFETLKRKVLKRTSDESPERALEEYILGFGEFFVKNPYFSAIFARELSKSNPPMPEKCIKNMFALVERLSQILKKGEKQGIFEKQNPFVIQLMIVSTLTTYQTTKKIRESIRPLLGESLSPDYADNLEGDLIPSLIRKIVKGIKC